jgi:hypothetical protein
MESFDGGPGFNLRLGQTVRFFAAFFCQRRPGRTGEASVLRGTPSA